MSVTLTKRTTNGRPYGDGICASKSYFMLGGYLFKNEQTIPKKRWILIGGISALVAWAIGIGISLYKGTTYSASYNYSHIFLLFTLVGIFFTCSYIPLNNRIINSILASIGDNTMGIYLLHRMVIFTFNKYADTPIYALPFLGRIAASVAVLLVSWGITVLIRKIPKLSFIVKL